jgi:hypothetical protein
MRPYSTGRNLGIGLRIVGRIVGRQISARAEAAVNPPARRTIVAAANQDAARATGQLAGYASRNLFRGLGGFLRPFRRVGGILWLEVTGVFFFLPVLVFAPNLWRSRPHNLLGPYDKTFLVTAMVVVVFFYLGVTSFWRARKR